MNPNVYRDRERRYHGSRSSRGAQSDRLPELYPSRASEGYRRDSRVGDGDYKWGQYVAAPHFHFQTRRTWEISKSLPWLASQGSDQSSGAKG